MSKYVCLICNKDFKQKSNYINHTVNKIKPCSKINNINSQNNINIVDIFEIIVDNNINDKDNDKNNDKNDKDNDEIDENNINMCNYCDKSFTRNYNLQRHLNGRCKSKKNIDELEKLKEKFNFLANNYQNLEKENENLKNENKKLKHDNINTTQIINNTITKNDNKQINNGIINNVNIQVVQFGNEDIDKLDLTDAIKLYLKSTGGNIVSNMLKYINLNEKYPENHNICITDISREIVKMHNGKKFIYKKFKNAKHDILDKVITHIKKLVDKYENDDTYKKSQDIETKLKINNNSLKLICGQDIEISDSDSDTNNEENEENEDSDIDEDNNNNNNNNNNKFNIENAEAQIIKLIENNKRDRVVNKKKEYSANIEHLNSKKEGLQKITFEKMKEELRNSKELLDANTKEDLLLK
jgi:hypothetical protein